VVQGDATWTRGHISKTSWCGLKANPTGGLRTCCPTAAEEALLLRGWEFAHLLKEFFQFGYALAEGRRIN
jgi:hypothetical protein